MFAFNLLLGCLSEFHRLFDLIHNPTLLSDCRNRQLDSNLNRLAILGPDDLIRIGEAERGVPSFAILAGAWA